MVAMFIKRNVDYYYIQNIWWIKVFWSVLTDHGQVIPEAARLALPEIDSASVRRCIMSLYIVDHQNRRARKGRSEKGAWTENTGVRRVLRLGHWLLSCIDSITRRKFVSTFKLKFILETFKLKLILNLIPEYAKCIHVIQTIFFS